MNDDFESKLNLFKKKALWKQLQGYQYLLKEREAEIANLRHDKNAVDAVIKFISMFNETVSASTGAKSETVHESFLPLSDALSQLSSFNRPLFDSFLSSLSAVAKDKISFKPMDATSLAAALQAGVLDEANNKIQVLEGSLFSAQKTLSALKEEQSSQIKASTQETTSPSKRAKLEEATAVEAKEEGDEVKVVKAELEALKQVSDKRLIELDAIFTENQRLKRDLDHQHEQLRKIPTEFLKDIPNLKFLQDELRRFRHDLSRADDTIKVLEREASDSNYRHNKIVADLERDLREKYSKLDEFVKSTDQELGRLRKDRDTMRQMYEQINSLLSAAQKQISIYESKLASNDAALKTLNELVSTLKSQISAISKLPTETPANIQSSLDALRADEQLYIDELENLGRAYEQLQSELTATQKKITDRDDQISRLLGEKLKAEFASSHIHKESESGLMRASKIEEIAKHRVAESEAREGQLRAHVTELERKIVDRVAAADSYKGRLSEASSEIALLRSKIDRLQGELVDLKNKQSASHSNSSSASSKDPSEYEKRRLVEELSVAKKKLEAYAASGIGIVKDLEEEVDIYKKLMKCNSCHTRDKNAVILKCMHCFCKQCLDIRLETRQRKCPNCGDPFGASDVKQIYL